jgi:uncharacterized protein (TIGR00159 family)
MDSIYLFFTSLRWQDILDICISSYILFRLYALFRGTAAFNVMVGLAFLWLFQGLSTKLGFIVLSSAGQNVTAAATIIIVVIFRNEIRAVFKTRNIRAIFWGTPHKVGRSSIEAVKDAVFDLSDGRIGALLVFPGKDDLDDQVQNGLPWQGVISKEMVKSIFWHGNPVHDGAAIVEGDRISRVAGILPLSMAEDLPAYFGTRHRAAVGLSEKSDALVVVVSEESGRVLTAKNGKYEYQKDKPALTSVLEEHLGRKSSIGKAGKSLRFEMTIAALLSFLLISIAWFSFTGRSDTLSPYDIPISYVGRASGVDIVSASVDTVKVQLIGADTLMKTVSKDKISVIVDLSDLPIGENTIKILPGSVSTPPGIDLNGVTPSEIEVVLDRVITKKLPVQIDWKEKLADNLLMVAASVQPSEVKVTGRSMLLKEMDTLYTEKISLKNITKSGSVSVSIAYPENIGPASGGKNRVNVLYKVEERSKETAPSATAR